MKKIIVVSLLALSSNLFSQAQSQPTGKLIDRYTYISNIETNAQANPFDVVVSVKFAKSILTVKQAIERLLTQSGYSLDANYESEKINNFKLPKVHREIGPIALKRAIKVLLGSAWDLQVDETTRSIQIVQTASSALQILTPDARTLIKNVVKPDVLDEVVAVSINNELLIDALNKILPRGWDVQLDEILVKKIVSVISEDFKREQVIRKVLAQAGAQGYFYKKLKLLVVRDNTKVIK